MKTYPSNILRNNKPLLKIVQINAASKSAIPLRIALPATSNQPPANAKDEIGDDPLKWDVAWFANYE